MLDLADVTELEAQVLQRATVTVGGTETLDGVTTTRLDIRIAPEAFADLFRDPLGSLGNAVSGEADIAVDRYLLSLWVDPDGYVRKLTFDLRVQLVVRDPELPEPVTLVETGTGEFHFSPVSEPIAWPESPEAFLQGQE
nr:MAG: hypothetical protein DIU70_09660 [Bacillota bacterium]